MRTNGRTMPSRRWLTGVAAGALLFAGSTLVVAQEAPESLLPPGFGDPPAPTPAPAPAPTPSPAQPSRPAPSAGSPGTPAPDPSGAVVQPIPGGQEARPAPPASNRDILAELPTLEELENLSTDELDELLGLRPQYDIPPAARRPLTRVGVIGPQEGGVPSQSLANQPGTLVAAVLDGMDGQFVSRWGHILLRRALTSRLAAPEGMEPVVFAAKRTALLNRMNEFAAARSLAQSVDTGEWNRSLTDAAVNAYLATSDILGICPAVNLQGTEREDAQWRMLQGICTSFAGESARAASDLNRVLRSGSAERIDALLAQRFAGASARGRRAVNIEWQGVEELTPWRFALANALGEEVPEELLESAPGYYRLIAATAPMLPIAQRLDGAPEAAERGILSSSAMVDLYSQAYVFAEQDSDALQGAEALRAAYVAPSPAQKLEALRAIWSDGETRYGKMVSTAFASARYPVTSVESADAFSLLASMLSAGLDRNALAWENQVEEGSAAWALLAVARPGEGGSVSSGDFDSFVDDDDSSGQRKAKLALAGLAGLGRLQGGTISDFEERLSVNLQKNSKWAQTIRRAAEVRNPTMVVLLAGLGMQGDSWARMTPAHLFEIVRSLDAVGLGAEARMIAAEAIARG